MATTQKDIATNLGISREQVKSALSGKGRVNALTRARVIGEVQRLGYRPNPHARSLSSGRSDEISLFTTQMHQGMFSQKVEAIQSLLNARGYDAPVHGYGMRGADCDEAQAEMIDTLRRRCPRAIICSGADFHKIVLEAFRRYQDEGGIVVSYGHRIELDCDQVQFDYADSIFRATTYLLEQGHRNIGLFNPGVSSNEHYGGRLRGFKSALCNHGALFNPDHIFDGQPFEPGGAVMAEQFLKLKNKPTALCMVNDASASAFVHALLRAGLGIPGDISVVGQDDSPQARYCMVPLTTVGHPVDIIANEAVELLCSRIEGRYEGASRQVVVRGTLVVRDSTGRI